MDKQPNYLTERAAEVSTWAGLAQVAVGIFVAATVGDVTGIGAGVVSFVTGLYNIFKKTKKG